MEKSDSAIMGHLKMENFPEKASINAKNIFIVDSLRMEWETALEIYQSVARA